MMHTPFLKGHERAPQHSSNCSTFSGSSQLPWWRRFCVRSAMGFGVALRYCILISIHNVSRHVTRWQFRSELRADLHHQLHADSRCNADFDALLVGTIQIRVAPLRRLVVQTGNQSVPASATR